MKPFFFNTGSGRRPQNLNKIVPTELIVLKLRDRVSQKDRSTRTVECLQELTLAITCLKDYSFNEGSCENEIKNMQKCFHDFANKSKTLESTGKRISPQVAQNLLDRYPNI